MREWVVQDVGSAALLVPTDVCDDLSGDDGVATVSYISASEALPLLPYDDAAAVGPRPPQQARALQDAQARAHDAAVEGRGDVAGYAQWVLRGRLPALVVSETHDHTGSRIWAGAWLHRHWALGRFPGKTVLEVGAGCGLLGLSLAAGEDAPRSLTLSASAPR